MVERGQLPHLNAFTRTYYDRGRAEGLAEGRLKGLREALREQLAVRGWTPDEASQRRIEACDDPDRLLAWLRRAATVDRLASVFMDDA